MVHDLIEDHVVHHPCIVRGARGRNGRPGEGFLPIRIARLAAARHLGLEDAGIYNPAASGIHECHRDAVPNALDDGKVHAQLRLGEGDEAARGNARSFGNRKQAQVAVIISQVKAAEVYP